MIIPTSTRRIFRRGAAIGLLTATLVGPIAFVSSLGPTAHAATATGLAATWGGKVDNSDAFVAIASNGKEILAYVCDGKTTAQWFKGAKGAKGVNFTKGRLDLTAKGKHLVATFTTDGAAGTVTLADGQSHGFTANRLAGDTGLFRLEQTVKGAKQVGGWVVLDGGETRGAVLNLNTGALVSLNSGSLVTLNVPKPDIARRIGPDAPY